MVPSASFLPFAPLQLVLPEQDSGERSSFARRSLVLGCWLLARSARIFVSQGGSSAGIKPVRVAKVP